MAARPGISAAQARRLFMGAQGLLDDPARRAGPAALAKLIERLGFVQVDTINVLARAHHLTLHTRLDGYRPSHFAQLVERDRFLFEHWTHDASVIPLQWYAQWKPRFRRDAEDIRGHAWWNHHLGANGEAVIAHVRERITAEGPVMSADFEHEQKRGEWWGGKPRKAGLAYLWRIGVRAVAKRIHFHKVYDLVERGHPEHHALPEPSPEAHADWACRTALDRLGVATAKEIAAFWQSVSLTEAKAWCEAETRAGGIAAVTVEGEARPAFAVTDFETRLRKLPEAPEHTRLLCPFDPVLRDRARALRLFGFDYRFEAFVPEPKRTFGYFVLPILEGERLVGRLDPKLHRDRGLLEIKGLWWEPGVKPTRTRLKALETALERLAAFVGAEDIAWPTGKR